MIQEKVALNLVQPRNVPYMQKTKTLRSRKASIKTSPIDQSQLKEAETPEMQNLVLGSWGLAA